MMSFIVANNNKIEYNDFIALAENYGAELQHILGSQKCKIIIAKRTSIDQLCYFLGAMLAGYIPTIIPHPSSKVQNEFFEQKMLKIEKAVSPSLCVCDDEDIDIYAGYFNTISNISGGNKQLNKVNKSPDETAFIQLSSGTTGIPKVIEISHKAVIAQCDEYATNLGLYKDDVIVSWLPLYHDMGLIACFMMPVLKGISFIHINAFEWLSNPSSLLENIQRHKGTHIWQPNFAFSYLAKRCKNDFDLSSVKNWISCSEITNYDDVVRFASHFNIPLDNISNCYALAENVFAVSQSKGIKTDNGCVSCGELLPGTSVLIENDKVLIKSSYLASNIDKVNGYYDTGDIGYIKNNELYISGRSDDMIIYYGKNIFPYEIEHNIGKIDGIIPGRVACVGVKNALGTQDINIIAETNNICDDVKQQIIQLMSKQFEVSCSVYLVEPGTIIKTSSGKINRKETLNKCCLTI